MFDITTIQELQKRYTICSAHFNKNEFANVYKIELDNLKKILSERDIFEIAEIALYRTVDVLSQKKDDLIK